MTSNATQLPQMLEQGARELGIELSAHDQDRLLKLVALLAKWSRAYNLTAIREPADMMRKHILDSLSVSKAVRGDRVLDVGTGAGFPGLPLAIISPQQSFVLLDGHAKKLRFVDHAAATFGLINVKSVHARVESYSDAAGFDSVVCRAFSSLADFVAMAGHLLAADGRLIAMKGRLDPDEIAAISDGWEVQSSPLKVPFVDEARHLVEIRRT